MKNFLMITLLFIICTSCTKTDDTVYFNFKSKLIRTSTNEPITNFSINIELKERIGTGYWSTDKIIYSKSIITDSNGNISVNLPFNNNEIFVKITGNPNENYGMIEQYLKFSDLNENSILEIKGFSYEKLNVIVKNLTQFDNQDAIRVKLLSDRGYLENIIDYGVTNFPIFPAQPPFYNDVLNTEWLGLNVNSIIKYRIVENTQYTIFWDLRRNGNWTYNNKSNNFISQTNTLNLYNLNY